MWGGGAQKSGGSQKSGKEMVRHFLLAGARIPERRGGASPLTTLPKSAGGYKFKITVFFRSVTN